MKTDIEDSEFHDFQRFFSKKGLWFIGWWENLSRWESVSVSSPYVPTSFSEVFYPIRDNGRLLVWLNGHDGDYYLDEPYMSYFLAQGYTVAAFNMPTLDPKEDMAKVHDKMGLFEHPGYSPIQAFLDPIAVELNYLLSKKSYRDVTMMGISGGGWTTTVYAAVDPRIDNSYPVAGGLPFYLRTLPPNENKPFGDWELTAPTLYSKADLLEMYVLAASSGRRQMQVLNQYDTCCWAGVNARSYERPISEKAATLGGEYSLYIDPNYTTQYRIRHSKL